MTQKKTDVSRRLHMTDKPDIEPTCETLCGGEAEFRDCLTIEQYKQFKQSGNVKPDDWCQECTARYEEGGLIFFGMPLKKRKG